MTDFCLDLLALPNEIFDIIVEHLVVTIGIYKAVLLRTVDQRFNASILQAICVAQCVDIHDPATPWMAICMPPSLRGKIIAVKSRRATLASQSYVSVVANVCQALDALIGESDPEVMRSQHEAIAGAVILKEQGAVDTQIEAHNILSGATIIGNLEIVRSLLQHNTSSSTCAVDVNGRTPYFPNLLSLAAARGHLQIVRHLIECGARLDGYCDEGYAYKRGYVYKRWSEHANWSDQCDLDRYASLRKQPPSALRVAVSGKHREVVRLFLHPEYRLPITSREYLRAILAAAEAGDLELIKELFHTIGEDLSEQFPEFWDDIMPAAARSGSEEVVQWLLDNGVDINACPSFQREHHKTALEAVSCLGNVSMARFLIQRGASVSFTEPPERFKQLSIKGAAECGQEAVVDLLLKHGADPAVALEGAASGGQPRLIKLLLSQFPDLPYREAGQLGSSVLFRALCSGNLTAITMLVEAGVSLDDSHVTHIMKTSGTSWLVDHLLSLGAPETKRVLILVDLGTI